MSRVVLQEVIRGVKGGGQTVQQVQTLFGEDTFIESHMLEKAELIDFVKKQLREQKRVFGTVSRERPADMLERAGNVLKTEENLEYASQADMALEMVGRLAHIQGTPLCDILNTYADQMTRAQNRVEVKRAALREILEAVKGGKVFEQGYWAPGEPEGASHIQESASRSGLDAEEAGGLFGVGARGAADEQDVLRRTVAEINKDHAIAKTAEDKFGKPGILEQALSRRLTRALQSIFKANVPVSDLKVEAVLAATNTPPNAKALAAGVKMAGLSSALERWTSHLAELGLGPKEIPPNAKESEDWINKTLPGLTGGIYNEVYDMGGTTEDAEGMVLDMENLLRVRAGLTPKPSKRTAATEAEAFAQEYTKGMPRE
jgi:hypothetical protein